MGFDLTKAPQPILDILLNKDVIAVNQDPAGNQGVLVHDDGKVQVLVKTLSASGERAVAVFNRGDAAAAATVTWKQLKLKAGSEAKVRDLWAHAAPASARNAIDVSVGPRETRMFKITGEPLAGDGRYLTEMLGRINVAADGVTVVEPDVTKASGGPRADLTPRGDAIRLAGQRHDYGVGIQANSRMEFRADRPVHPVHGQGRRGRRLGRGRSPGGVRGLWRRQAAVRKRSVAARRHARAGRSRHLGCRNPRTGCARPEGRRRPVAGGMGGRTAGLSAAQARTGSRAARPARVIRQSVQ